MSTQPLLLRWDSGGTVRYFWAEVSGYAGEKQNLARKVDRSADDGTARVQQAINPYREFMGTLQVKAEPTLSKEIGGDTIDEGSFDELQEAYAADDLEICSTFDADYWAGTFVEDLAASPQYDPMLNYASVPVKIVQTEVEVES